MLSDLDGRVARANYDREVLVETSHCTNEFHSVQRHSRHVDVNDCRVHLLLLEVIQRVLRVGEINHPPQRLQSSAQRQDLRTLIFENQDCRLCVHLWTAAKRVLSVLAAIRQPTRKTGVTHALRSIPAARYTRR